jgi:hypothetical protein
MNGFLSSLSKPTITANSEEEAEAQDREGKRPAPSASTAVCGDD